MGENGVFSIDDASPQKRVRVESSSRLSIGDDKAEGSPIGIKKPAVDSGKAPLSCKLSTSEFGAGAFFLIDHF